MINKFPCAFKSCRNNAQKIMLLLRKGVYAYEYMDSIDKFKEKELPAIDTFYSSLSNSNISKDGYNHAKKVWNLFKIKNLVEYHDLYVKADTA